MAKKIYTYPRKSTAKIPKIEHQRLMYKVRRSNGAIAQLQVAHESSNGQVIQTVSGAVYPLVSEEHKLFGSLAYAQVFSKQVQHQYDDQYFALIEKLGLTHTELGESPPQRRTEKGGDI